MNFPTLEPVTLPTGSLPWVWAVGGVLVLAFLGWSVWTLRGIGAKIESKPAPPPHEQARRALAAIPGDWPTARSAAAGARIVRGYLGAVGFSLGPAYPAREFAGMREAGGFRPWVDLLERLEGLACRPYPERRHWDEARDELGGLLAGVGQEITQADEAGKGAEA